MRATLAVSVQSRVCQHWLTRDWASSGALLVSSGQLPKLLSSEDILAHPCGEYVLDQLQRGVSPDHLADVLLQEHLVVADSLRLRLYRFCEDRGDYWTVEHLELNHWEYLIADAAGGRRAGWCHACSPRKNAWHPFSLL